MRTTLEIPDELLRRAKIAAVQRGTTLKELIGAALEQELRANPNLKRKTRRAKFPIFPSASPGTLKLTNARISQEEAEEDARRHDLTL